MILRAHRPAALAIAFASVVALVAGAPAAEEVPLRSLDPPVLLPDGSEFKTWEAPGPLEFAKTYHVDPSHPQASDDGPGTAERPFATIGRAAAVAGPGERVLIAGGVYRETVRPARGGAGPRRMVSYEAAPEARPVLKGSSVFKPDWSASKPEGREAVKGAFQAKLDPALFQGYNPFDIENVTEAQFAMMEWAAPLRGKPPCTLTRGLVFQDGKLLARLSAYENLAGKEGAFWLDRPAQVLHLRPFGGGEPAASAWEITTRETVFAPVKPLGFIRVKGLAAEYVAGPFPWEQVGAISASGGNHWIIEDNSVRFANGVGIDVGRGRSRGGAEPFGHHIVRRNVVADCGICGICGLGPGNGKEFGLLIEDNAIARCAWVDVERLYETAGIKTHCNVRCLIRRNLVLDTLHGPGIWMDWDNRFSRCSGNVVVGTRTMHGGIFVEASFEPNLVDGNVVWGTEGRGIYEHDSTRQVFAHNLIGASKGAGFHLHGKMTDRRIAGRPIESGRHRVLNNILVGNEAADVFRGDRNEAAGNLRDGLTASLERGTLEILWSFEGEPLSCAAVPGVTRDIRGLPRVAVVPGPFASLPRQGRILLWPLAAGAPALPVP